MATKRAPESFRKPIRDDAGAIKRDANGAVTRDDADTAGHVKRAGEAARRMPDEAGPTGHSKR